MHKKLPIFGLTLLTMLCLGLVYGWSIFVVPLEEEFGWTRFETSLTFTISMVSMCIGIMAGGQFNKQKDRAFITLLIAAALLFSGFAMAGRADRLMDFYIFYGAFCGFGVGFAYTELIAIPTKWFHGKQGFTSGLLMMCFGLGAMILGTICSNAMENIGWRRTFVILGVVFGALVLAEGAALQSTVKAKAESGSKHGVEDSVSLTTKQMIQSADFKLLYLWHIFISAAGLALMGHIAPCAMQIGAPAAASALIAGIVSVSNGAGRIVFGILYDKLGVRKTLITISLYFLLACAAALAAVSMEEIPVLIAACVMMGMSFGAAPTSSSAILNRFYGPKYFAANFGVISTMLIVAAAVGPYMAGRLYNATGNYVTTFYGVLGLGVLSLIFVFIILKIAGKNGRKLD